MTALFKDAQSKKLLTALLLVVITLIVYLPVKDNDFINFDDTMYVTHNLRVQRGLNWDNFVWAFKSLGVASNWHPLTWLSHMADCQLYGLNTTGHHFMSLTLHAINVVLLFLLIQALTGSIWRSAFVAALFAVHPLNVESVAWIAERKNVLSTMFWLLTTWAYLKYVRQPTLRRYVYVLLFFSLGLMAKPMLVTLPFVLLLLDYWPLSRFRAPATVSGRAATHSEDPFSDQLITVSVERIPSFWHRLFQLTAEKIPLFVISAASSVVTVLAQRDGGALVGAEVISLKVRLANALLAYIEYLSKTLWPVKLSIFYPHQLSMPEINRVLLAGAVLGGVTALVLWQAKRRGYFLVGWLWFLGTLVPVIGLVQVGGQAMADRYAYVPLIGVFIMLSWGTVELVSRLELRALWWSAAAICTVLALSIVTRHQVGYWHTSVTLFKHAIAVTDGNYLAYNNLGTSYSDVGMADKALEHYLEAVNIRPAFGLAHYNAALALTQKDQIEEAMPHYWQALQHPTTKKNQSDTLNNLGVIMEKKGDNSEAINFYMEALHVDPDNTGATMNIGALLERQGKLNEAIAGYHKALERNPHPVIYFKLGRVMRDEGDLQESVRQYQQALALDPEFISAQEEMNEVLRRMDEANRRGR